MTATPLDIASRFQVIGIPVSAECYGNGTINDTFCVVCEPYRRYILQRINREAFPDVPRLMANMHAVLVFLQRKFAAQGQDPFYHCLTLVAPKQGQDYLCDENGDCWRMFFFLEDTVSLCQTSSLQQSYAAGKAFGTLEAMLFEFPASSVFDVLPFFRDTRRCIERLEKLMCEDPCGRAADVREEWQQIRDRAELASLVVSRLQSGELPPRVVHNDARVDNLLFDLETEQVCAVIDLDTVMMGSVLYDFGDGVRSCCNTAGEEETDLRRVQCDLTHFQAYTEGFLTACGGTLTERELSLLPESAQLMTLDGAAHTLIDYLMGDRVFQIAYPTQNIDRCRAQLTLLRDIENKTPQMHDIVRRIRV